MSEEKHRRQFVDGRGHRCWIQSMGPFESETAYWIGGDGYEWRVFTSIHKTEADFDEDELRMLEQLLRAASLSFGES